MRCRWTAGVLVGTAFVMTLTACTQRTDVNTTNDAAHSTIIRLLNESLDGLPPRTTLSRTIPGRSGIELFPVSSPCDDNDSDPDQAYRWSLGLWALLPGTDSPESATAMLNKHWQAQGYKVRGPDDDPIAETPDGFTLTHTTSARGDMSVSAESPCFPKSQLNRSMEWPRTLSR